MNASDIYLKASALAGASRRAREATEERNTLIREMHAAGLSLRGIAEHAGLSHTAVANIVRGKP